MGATQFLSTLPAILGLTGFIVYYFLLRNRGGDRVTLDIVGKLRRDAPGLLPADAEKLDPATLTKLIESDATLRSKISRQDFQLLRDALRQQFITSLVVYIICGLIFVVGVLFYWYTQPTPLTITSISAESTTPSARGLPVDSDPLLVKWIASGVPEDIAVVLEELDHHRRTATKTVRSTEGRILFQPDEYRDILNNRSHNAENRVRAIIQASNSVFYSPEFSIHVPVTIVSVHANDKVKIMGTIDNTAIDNYDFEAQLVVWASKQGQEPAPVTIPENGRIIRYGENDFPLDHDLKYDWSTVKLIYLGPDDLRIVRTEFLGF